MVKSLDVPSGIPYFRNSVDVPLGIPYDTKRLTFVCVVGVEVILWTTSFVTYSGVQIFLVRVEIGAVACSNSKTS